MPDKLLEVYYNMALQPARVRLVSRVLQALLPRQYDPAPATTGTLVGYLNANFASLCARLARVGVLPSYQLALNRVYLHHLPFNKFLKPLHQPIAK